MKADATHWLADPEYAALRHRLEAAHAAAEAALVDGAGYTTLRMGESTGDENANLYMRGVNEGRSGDLLEAPDLLDILDVFGEDGMRSYLMGLIEGEADATENQEVEE